MKKLLTVLAVVMAAATTCVLNAADYMFAVNNSKWNDASWVRIGDETATLVAPPSGDNVFWLINGYQDAASGKTGQPNCWSTGTKMPGTLCLGSALDSPFGLRSANLLPTWGEWLCHEHREVGRGYA